MILSCWPSRIRTSDEQAYAHHARATLLGDLAAAFGNRGAQIFMKRLADGVTEVMTLGWWTSIEALQAFARSRSELPQLSPDEDSYFLDSPSASEAYILIAQAAPPLGRNGINY